MEHLAPDAVQKSVADGHDLKTLAREQKATSEVIDAVKRIRYAYFRTSRGHTFGGRDAMASTSILLVANCAVHQGTLNVFPNQGRRSWFIGSIQCIA